MSLASRCGSKYYVLIILEEREVNEINQHVLSWSFSRTLDPKAALEGKEA